MNLRRGVTPTNHHAPRIAAEGTGPGAALVPCLKKDSRTY